MANTIRIKRRATGAAGAPASLQNAELAYNEVDDILYYGKGTGGAGGTATSVIGIAGTGAYVALTGTQTITGNKTFSGTVDLGSSAIASTPASNSNGTTVATTAFVQGLIGNIGASFTVAGDSGSNQTITGGIDTLTIAGGTGLSSVAGATDTITLNLDNTAVTAGNYGAANSVATFTVDAQGRLTAASNTTISISSSQITDLTEGAQDAAATLFTNGTHSGIAASYDDANAKLNLDVADFTITLGGDLTGNVTITNLANATLTATVAANSVELGTDTTGNYVGSISAGTGISLSNTGVEGGTFTVTNDGVTSLTGTANEVTVSGSSGSVTIGLPDDVTVGGNLTVTGDLLVSGNTTTLNTATLTVEDKNVVLANVTSPNDTTADGAGITVLGATDKTFNWVDATDAWTSSEHLNLLTGKEFKINGTSVLSSSTLGSGVTTSSLTSVGTISTGTWQGTVIGLAYGGTGANSASGARTALELGTIATQNASNVSITGGNISSITLDLVTIDGGAF